MAQYRSVARPRLALLLLISLAICALGILQIYSATIGTVLAAGLVEAGVLRPGWAWL